MHVFYGNGDTYADITDDVFSRCFDGERIYVAADDNARARMFSDPLHGVVKDIVVIRTESNGTTCASYDARRPVDLVLSGDEKAAIVAKLGPRDSISSPSASMKSVDERIRHIHRQLQFTGGSMEDEWPEQAMVMRFLPSDAKVLELGANIGRNTLMISCVLDDDRNFVTLECDPISAQLLRNNRHANGRNFHIEPAALSYRRLIQKGWETVPSDVDLPGYRPVDTVTFEQVRDKYRIDFDTLVVDCEGGLHPILEDNDSILTGIKLVIIESDFRTVEDKRSVEAVFQRHGLEKVYSEALSVTWNHPFPKECAESFFEVWKKD